jgi:hypothetical protein
MSSSCLVDGGRGLLPEEAGKARAGPTQRESKDNKEQSGNQK